MTKKALFILGVILCTACRMGDTGKGDNWSMIKWKGETMGTYYAIQFFSSVDPPINEQQIDSILTKINLGMSTYIDSSLISNINRSDTTYNVSYWGESYVKMLRDNLNISHEVYEKTEGYFDPSVMPLVNYWGFGHMGRTEQFVPDTAKLRAMAQEVGLDMFTLQYDVFRKPSSGSLDFSAVAKGYAVDEIVDFLAENAIENAMVDIGGEIRVIGEGGSAQGWIIGISRPDPKASLDEVSIALILRNKAIATSGNYRNFYTGGDGRKYVHTIDPHTGMAEESNLLSATVVMDRCAEADAWATALMASGLERSRRLIQNNPSVEAMLLYAEGDTIKTFMTPGIKNIITN